MTGEISAICARSDLFLVVGPNPSAPIQRSVDITIRAGGRLDDILVALTSEGLTLAPAFAAAEPVGDEGTDTRILVRGHLQLELERIEGDRFTVTPGRSTTWNDDVVSDVRRIMIGVPGGTQVVWVHPAAPPEAVDPGPARADVSTAATSSDEEVPAVDKPSESSEETNRLSRDAMHRLGVGTDADSLQGGQSSHAQAAGETPVVSIDHQAAEADNPASNDGPAAETSAAPVPAPGVALVDQGDTPHGRWDDVDPEDDPYLSNLLDHTIFHDVESAAVRSTVDTDDPEANSGSGAPDTGNEGITLSKVAAPIHEDSATLQEPPDALLSARSPTPASPPTTRSARAGVIAAVPGMRAQGPRTGDVLPPDALTSRRADLPPPAAADDPMIGDGLGDNDGHTVAIRDAVAAANVGDSPAAEAAGTPALRCRRGHLNPPTAAQCRSCGLDVTGSDMTHAVMPVVARLRFDTGLVVDVDRMQVIGRQPTATGFEGGGQIPNLVALPSPEGDLSRIHVAIRLEDWNILVEDLGSTNGTEVQLPQQEPERLREFSPKLVVPGTTVTLGGAATFHIDLPE